jgi:single-stranded-DNA-specific exonuclease
LRLLCTQDPIRASELAMILGQTNKSRQDLTQAAVNHALTHVNLDSPILIVADTSYPQGIIGLIASKLTEKYYKPAIAVSVGETESKASARSVSGFHITDHIRSASSLLLGAGGHAMAAGFTVETAKLELLKEALSNVNIAPEILIRKQRIDAEIPLELVTWELWQMVQEFAPFGLGNPTPVFKTTNVNIDNVKRVGKDYQHAKLTIRHLDAMAFNFPEIPDNPVDLVYTIDRNVWNGTEKLQLIVKSITPS